VVVTNGEIYNYVELRAELESRGHRFRTASDTEALLHGYREWGEALPGHLVGMFAFAVADRAREELFVARDRFGEKPLYLAETPTYVAFASEVKPLCALPDLPRELDLESLGQFLCLNYVPGEGTLLGAVRRLPPGAWKLFSRGADRRGRYWEPPGETEPRVPRDDEDVLAQWRARFDGAVRICLRSDVPVGIFLSGGMDSSLVAEAAVRQGRLHAAYVIDFEEEGYREYPAARLVADRLGLPVQRTVLTPAALEHFLELVDHADDPMADSSCLPVWVLSREAARHSKTVLGGDGGDELMAGYLTYRASQVHARYLEPLPRLPRRLVAAAARHLPTTEGKVTFSYRLRRFLRAAHLPHGLAHLSWNGTWLPEEAAALVNPGPARAEVAGALERHAARAGLPERYASLLAMQRADVAEYLPNDILTKMDRMSMAHGLETRAPFLDYRLAEWCLRLPERFKIGGGGELKALLRTAARRLFGPEIADRPKKGFSIPVHQWTRGPLRGIIGDLLSETSVARTGILSPRVVSGVAGDHFAGRKSYGFELWGLAVLMAWHRMRVERPPVPPPDSPLLERRFPRTIRPAAR